MADRLPDQKTPSTKEELLEALWRAWLHLFGEPPKKESIWILMAQWALETGWGKYCHNYNLGNVKSSNGDGYDYTYFACNEILKTAQAQAYAAKSPDTAKITVYRKDGTAIIWFYPDHPGCRFRAFHTLLEGATDHISIVHKRFSKAWPAVIAGNPAQYSHMLRQQGYYTADESSYTKTLVSVYNTIKAVKFDYDSLPVVNEEQSERIMNLVALTMQQSIEESTRFTRVLFDDEDENPTVDESGKANA